MFDKYQEFISSLETNCIKYIADFFNNKSVLPTCLIAKNINLQNKEGTLLLISEEKKLEIEFNRKNLYYLLKAISYSVSEKDIIITWDCKDLFSLFYNSATFNELKLKGEISLFSNNLYDLHYLGNYVNITLSDKPEKYSEIINCFKKIQPYLDKQVMLIYKIIIALATTTIPNLEQYNFILTDSNTTGNAYYKIGHHKNGRLVATQDLGFNIHNSNQTIQPAKTNHVFLVADYNAMEVCTLALLSQDKNLLTIINNSLSNNEDVYSLIFKFLFRSDCDTEEKRNFIKNLFLPLYYGAGFNELQKTCHQLTPIVYDQVLTSIKKKFSTSWEWLHSAPKVIDGVLTDFFGRKRLVENEFQVLNSSIQSPAAIICLTQLLLVKKWVIGSKHDAYIFSCQEIEVPELKWQIKEILSGKDYCSLLNLPEILRFPVQFTLHKRFV